MKSVYSQLRSREQPAVVAHGSAVDFLQMRDWSILIVHSNGGRQMWNGKFKAAWFYQLGDLVLNRMFK